MPSPSVALLRLQSDERLVDLVRAGHERAFEAIVERYRRPLLRHARRMLTDARAEDIVQQALMKAWSALQRGDEVRDLPAWLHRIVHNAALNALRGHREEFTELRDSLVGSGGPDEVLERQMMVRETLETLAALPERQRAALLRIAVEGRSQEEVARELGLTHGAVRQLLHRARTTVRAAATAVTPLPLAVWLAAAGARAEPVAARLAEIVGAGGSAGVGATLAKAGAIAVLAGGGAAADRALDTPDRPRPPAVARLTPSDLEARSAGPRAARRAEPSPPSARRRAGNTEAPRRERAATRRAPRRRPAAPTGAVAPAAGGTGSAGLAPAPAPAPEPAPEPRARERDSSGPGSGRAEDDSSGPGSGGTAVEPEPDSSGPGSAEEQMAAAAQPEPDSSGPGSAEEQMAGEPDSSGHGSGGDDPDDSSGSGSNSGPGSGDDPD